MNHLSDRVRQERLRRQLSVRAAAAAGGISNTWWGRFEDYLQPLTPQIAAAVAKAFDWPEDWAYDPLTDLTRTTADEHAQVLAELDVTRLDISRLRSLVAKHGDQLQELVETVAVLQRQTEARLARLERQAGGEPAAQ